MRWIGHAGTLQPVEPTAPHTPHTSNALCLTVIYICFVLSIAYNNTHLLHPSLEKMPLMPVLSWLMAFMALRWRFSYSSALSLVRFRRSSCRRQGTDILHTYANEISAPWSWSLLPIFYLMEA